MCLADTLCESIHFFTQSHVEDTSSQITRNQKTKNPDTNGDYILPKNLCSHFKTTTNPADTGHGKIQFGNQDCSKCDDKSRTCASPNFACAVEKALKGAGGLPTRNSISAVILFKDHLSADIKGNFTNYTSSIQVV